MGVSAGPNITRDGLLVYYDIANSNSFRGEATTNLVNPDWTTWSLDASGFTTVGTRTIISTYYIRITDVNANARHNTWVYSLSGNTIYTFSVKYRRIVGTPTLRFQIQFYNGGSYLGIFFPTTAQIGIVDSGDWQTATYTVTTPATTDRVLWFIQDGDDYVGYTHTFELKEAQAEAKAYATAFVVGTRGTTVATGGGLTSLLSTSNAEVVNGASYSNTFGGILNFDGTNDHVRLPSITTTTLSVSVWVRSSSWSTQTHPMIVAKGINVEWILWKSDDSSYDEKFGWRSSSGSNIYSTTTAQNNTWYHLLATVGAAGQRLYVNGILEASNGTTSVPSGSLEICIGAGLSGGNPANFLLGNISSMKIWNRQLSATEVMNDYLTTRTRLFTRETPVTSNLILHLDASNRNSYSGSGTAWRDLSGYGNHFTLFNGVKYKSEKGGSLSFDGTNDYAISDNNLNLTTYDYIVVDVWFRSNTTSTTAMLVEHTTSWNENTGGWGVAINTNGNVDSPGSVHTNHNTEVARNYLFNMGTFWNNQVNIFSKISDSTGRLTYCNGNLVSFDSGPGYGTTTVTTAGGSFPNAKLYIGSRGGSIIFFNGSISSLKIYGVKLTAHEVSTNFTSVRNRFLD